MRNKVYTLGTQHPIFASLGIDPTAKKDIELEKNWLCHSLNHNNPTKNIPVILIERGPKNIVEIKKSVKNFDACIVLFAERNALFLKAGNESHTAILESSIEYEKIASILTSYDIANTTSELEMEMKLIKVINAIPTATKDFDNRGLFSTHYLRSRIFDDAHGDTSIDDIKQKINSSPDDLLRSLGWDISNSDGTYFKGKVSITVTDQDDFSIRKTDGDIAPSYIAISELNKCQWSILTNGKKWRLYTNKISASSTNYFEITLEPKRDSVLQYLVTIFGASAFEEKNGRANIDVFFDEGKNYATELEENLSEKITSTDGIFLHIIKGVLDHDMKRIFSAEELEEAKKDSLKIMYRIWFLAYAEARDLLPIKDDKYQPISLQSIRNHLDSYDSVPDGTSCWKSLLKLFQGIKKGNVEHNLPQYNGNLFKNSSIDQISIKNKFIVHALHELLESDGQAIDYANLGVRHLGNIFENLMEFGVKQAEKDIMLLVDKNGVKEVATKQQSSYSYKKNDLYLASKRGIAEKKITASYYTPDKIVEFLVERGLRPILDEREALINDDLKGYKKNKSDKNLQICMNRLLDIQVLDPAMGSGHFLVEALNKITAWATRILKTHPSHPLLDEIESDREYVIAEQKRKKITINENQLTHDVLLKRKIMKRCIFGVDLNPMAVELTKLSLWLDSFAIGVPLTYMDHHIKLGDSTIGMFLDDLKNKEMHTLDDWSPGTKSNETICDVISNSDITVEQIRHSEDKYNEHIKSLEPTKRVLDALTTSKITPSILPKKSKNEFIHKFGKSSKNEPKEFTDARDLINKLEEKHQFFHWELEMMDAFTDSRSGFDVIIGNPPWEKMKPNNDEFFTPYDPTFKSLKPNTKKKQRMEKLLQNLDIKKEYERYRTQINEKNAFCTIHKLQGVGDKDLWMLIFERALNLVAKNGIISMVVPSQILTNIGAGEMRKQILEKDILSLYVFENRKKIFQIHSSYRFVLLSFCNRKGEDEFPVGFYLHDVKSLDDTSKEKEKFSVLSKKTIHDLSPTEYVIPEIVDQKLDLLKKIFQNNPLGEGLESGWNIKLSSGFHKTNDANLFNDDNEDWPVFEGRNIHQYIHDWSRPEFTTRKKEGLERESTKKVYVNRHKEIHDCFRLMFRDTSGPTNMRTVISTIIPPHTFHTYSLRSIVLYQNNKIITNSDYDKKISYLCGVFNSLVFDFTARTKIQLHLSTILKSLPVPNSSHEDRISELSGMLVMGDSKFEEFAESLRIKNNRLTPAQRIEVTAEMDALVAHSYNLTKEEYMTIIDSFNSFKKNPSLYDLDEIVWNNTNLKEFYGEVAELSLDYYDEITKEAQS